MDYYITEPTEYFLKLEFLVPAHGKISRKVDFISPNFLITLSSGAKAKILITLNGKQIAVLFTNGTSSFFKLRDIKKEDDVMIEIINRDTQAQDIYWMVS